MYIHIKCILAMCVYVCVCIYIYHDISICIYISNAYKQYDIYIYIYIYIYIVIMTGPLPEWVECSPVVRKTEVQSLVESCQRLKNMIFDAALLNTQHYKVRIKDKIEQSTCALPDITVYIVAIEKRVFGSPSTTVANLLISSCHTASTNFPDSLSPFVPIIHRFR